MDDDLLARWRRSPRTPDAPARTRSEAPPPTGLDATVPGTAPWDRPSSAWDDLPLVDDRGPDWPMEPRPRFVASPRTPATDAFATDPYDADAPVLDDIRPTPAASWPAWSEPSTQGRSPITPPSLVGRGIGPTPPADLFAPARKMPPARIPAVADPAMTSEHAPFAPPSASFVAPLAAPSGTMDLWAQPISSRSWQQSAPPSDPLALLPAATLAPGELPPLFAPPDPAAAERMSAQREIGARPARPAPEQSDLWPAGAERTQAEGNDADIADSEEPSSMVTLALTLLMAVVVMGLVLAFVWQMTSLPVLR